MSSSTTWNRIFLLTSRDAPCPCPVCGGKLAYRDSRKRIWQQIGGEKKHIMIPRFQCQNCDRYHNGLPDCLVPYKHYGAQEIEDVIDKVITPEDDAGDGPSFETMLRWLAWFQMNLERVEGYLRQIFFRLSPLHAILPDKGSLLEKQRETISPGWLGAVLRAIYNAGGFLPAWRRFSGCT